MHILAYACSKGARFSVKLSSIEKLAFISDLQIVGILCSMYIYLSSFVSVLVSYCHSLNVLHCAFSENIHALKTYSINLTFLLIHKLLNFSLMIIMNFH